MEVADGRGSMDTTPKLPSCVRDIIPEMPDYLKEVHNATKKSVDDLSLQTVCYCCSCSMTDFLCAITGESTMCKCMRGTSVTKCGQIDGPYIKIQEVQFCCKCAALQASIETCNCPCPINIMANGLCFNTEQDTICGSGSNGKFLCYEKWADSAMFVCNEELERPCAGVNVCCGIDQRYECMSQGIVPNRIQCCGTILWDGASSDAPVSA